MSELPPLQPGSSDPNSQVGRVYGEGGPPTARSGGALSSLVIAVWTCITAILIVGIVLLAVRQRELGKNLQQTLNESKARGLLEMNLLDKALTVIHDQKVELGAEVSRRELVKLKQGRLAGEIAKAPARQRQKQPADMRHDRSPGITKAASNASKTGNSSAPRIVSDAPLVPVSPQQGKEIESERKGAQAEKPASDSLNPGRAASSSQIATGVLVPPRPLKQVMPTTKSFASLAVLSPMTITVQVKIDKLGNVVEARALPSTSPNSLYWSTKAVEAAKQWTFEPAKIHGESVASEHTIVFRFAPAAATY